MFSANRNAASASSRAGSPSGTRTPPLGRGRDVGAGTPWSLTGDEAGGPRPGRQWPGWRRVCRRGCRPPPSRNPAGWARHRRFGTDDMSRSRRTPWLITTSGPLRSRNGRKGPATVIIRRDRTASASAPLETRCGTASRRHYRPAEQTNPPCGRSQSLPTATAHRHCQPGRARRLITTSGPLRSYNDTKGPATVIIWRDRTASASAPLETRCGTATRPNAIRRWWRCHYDDIAPLWPSKRDFRPVSTKFTETLPKRDHPA